MRPWEQRGGNPILSWSKVGNYDFRSIQSFTGHIPFNLWLFCLNFFVLSFADPIFLTLHLSYGFHPLTLEGTAVRRKVTCSPGKRGCLSASLVFLSLFPSPCALGALPDSGEMSPWIVAFLFTEEQFIAPGVSPEGEGGVEAPVLDCPGVLLPGFL